MLAALQSLSQFVLRRTHKQLRYIHNAQQDGYAVPQKRPVRIHQAGLKAAAT
jgi:hypothetical protein